MAAKATGRPASFVRSQTLGEPQGEICEMMLDLILRIVVPPVRRRIEMEINAGDRHVARLRSMTISRSGGERMLRFRGKVELDRAGRTLVPEARPSRQFRVWDNEQAVATYGALPFQLVSTKFSPTG